MENSLPTPSLDSWTTLFLVVAGQGLFLAAFLFNHKKGIKLSNKLLGLLILVFSITLIDYVGYWSKYNLKFPHLASIFFNLTFFIGPLFFLYFRSIEYKGRLPKKDLLHLVFPIFMLAVRLPHFLLPYSEKILILTRQKNDIYHLVFPYFHISTSNAILTVGHLILYGVLASKLVADTNKERKENFSFSRELVIKTRWYKILTMLYWGVVLGFLVYYILIRTPYFTLFYDYSISLAMSVMIYSVGYLGYKQPEIFSGDWLTKVFQPSKYQTSSLTTSASKSLFSRLQTYMEEQKPFLDNELRLKNLAQSLEVSPHHLSQVINEKTDKSFSNYINDFRIEEVIELFKDPHYAQAFVIDIAYAAGFNNKTSFYKAFKEKTGMSPTAYRKQLEVQHGKASLES